MNSPSYDTGLPPVMNGHGLLSRELYYSYINADKQYHCCIQSYGFLCTFTVITCIIIVMSVERVSLLYINAFDFIYIYTLRFDTLFLHAFYAALFNF